MNIPKAISSKRGFTLIEIVLVLAIAGLIMIVVFLAVTGAQRSRRDTQRKNDIARVVAGIEKFRSNHLNQPPASTAELNDVVTNYVDNLADPINSTPYTVTYRSPSSSNTAIPPVGTMYYQQGKECADGSATTPITGPGTDLAKFALWGGMEAGSAGAFYCLDNS